MNAMKILGDFYYKKGSEDKIEFLREESGNKNETIKTLLKNIN